MRQIRRRSSGGDAIVIEDSPRPHHPPIGAQSGSGNVAPSDNSPLGGHPIVEATSMFGTLLESRARRRRRPGGAAVSVAVHMAIIGAITAGTVHGKAVSKEKPGPVLLRFKNPPPPPPRPVDHAPIRDLMPGPVIAGSIRIHRIDPPQTILDHLPSIDSSFGRGIDSIVIGHGQSGAGARRSAMAPSRTNRANGSAPICRLESSRRASRGIRSRCARPRSTDASSFASSSTRPAGST